MPRFAGANIIFFFNVLMIRIPVMQLSPKFQKEMRALKTILIILVALAGILLILGYTGPKTSVVQRSVVIDAEPATIYPYVASLRETHNWGPWIDMEREVVTEWSEEDGVVGASQSWEGDTLGKGMQRIIAMEPDRKVSTELTFLEPWESKSEVDLVLTPEEQGTRVDWVMTSQNKGLARLMAVFMDMDGMIGPDFERGLEKLKATVEEKQRAQAADLQSRTHRGYVIETIERPQMTYIGKREKKLKWTEFEKFYGQNFGGAYAAAGAQGIEPVCCPSGIFFAWNEEEQTADVMAGIPVKGGEEIVVKGWETYTVPTSKMLHIKYYGAYDKSAEAHYAMDDMIKANGLTHYGNVIEEYVTDPSQEPDTAKWLTNIYYMVR